MKPYISIVDMLAEEKGHLLYNDMYLSSLLADAGFHVSIWSSPESLSEIRKNGTILRPSGELPLHGILARRLPFRIRTFCRSLLMHRQRTTHVVFQSFEEISAYLFTYLSGERKLILITTNNLANIEDRCNRWRKWLLSRVFDRIHAIVVHSDFESKLIARIFPRVNRNKIIKVRYHQCGVIRQCLAFHEREQSICYIGGGRSDQGFERFQKWACNHQFADTKFDIACNATYERVIPAAKDNPNINFRLGYQSDFDYWNFLAKSRYVALPYDIKYEGKTSGIFHDAISTGTPILGPNIEPFVSLFKQYGPMGHLIDFDDTPPAAIVKTLSDPENYEVYQRNMMVARADHSPRHILADYLRVIAHA